MAKFGQNHTKLSHEQVYAIKKKYAAGGYSYGRLGREYGVNAETIGRICRGEARVNVPDPVRLPTEEEARESMARVMARLNETAERLPVAQEIAADKALDEFTNKP